MDVSSVLYDQSEKVKMIVGESYFQSTVTGGGVNKSTIILTDKRVYQLGRAFEKIGSKMVKLNRNTTLDIEDVKGVTVQTVNNMGSRIGLGVFGVLAGGLAILFDGMDSIQMIFGFISMLYIALAIFLPVKKYLFIDFAGGSIACEHSWYGDEEVRQFQKAVFIEKDAIKVTKNITPVPQVKTTTYIQEIEQLGELKAQGIITEEQFEEKRNQLLG